MNKWFKIGLLTVSINFTANYSFACGIAEECRSMQDYFTNLEILSHNDLGKDHVGFHWYQGGAYDSGAIIIYNAQVYIVGTTTTCMKEDVLKEEKISYLTNAINQLEWKDDSRQFALGNSPWVESIFLEANYTLCEISGPYESGKGRFRYFSVDRNSKDIVYFFLGIEEK